MPFFKPNYYNTKHTVELRDLIESGVNIWDFEYESYYNGEAKTAFEQKVIDHFYFRQIGQETTGRFKHMFKTRVREIMPYYVQLYKTEQIMAEIEDPFGNVDITETYEEEATQRSTAENTASVASDETHTRKYSNTPQNRIENLDQFMTEAEQNAGDSTSSTAGTSTGEGESTVKHTLHRKGNHGVNTYAHDMIEYRQTLLNIDMMIIKDLNCLFLGIY